MKQDRSTTSTWTVVNSIRAGLYFQSAIWHCLNNYAFTDAVFLGERLYAEVGSDEALHLLATCYYRSGRPQHAYSLLSGKGSPSPQCRYLAAQCCLSLNKLAEAEASITGSVAQKNKNVVEDVVTEFGELSSFALRLLADVYSKTENTSRAVECLQRSLSLNPFLWSSFQSLCHLGEKPDASRSFQINAQTLSTVCQTSVYATPLTVTPSITNTSADTSMDLQDEMPAGPLSIYIDPTVTPDSTQPVTVATQCDTTTTQPAVRWRSCLSGPLGLSPLTPSFGVLPLDNTPTPVQVLTMVPPTTHLCVSPAVTAHFKTRGVSNQLQPATGHVKPVFSQSGNTNTVLSNQTSALCGNNNNNMGLRRSSRLFTSVKENNKNTSEINKLVLSPRAPAKKTKSRQPMTCTSQLNDKNKTEITTNAQTQVALMQRQSADGLMQLMQELAAAYLALSQFNCRQAIELFESLPPRHYNTGWVLCNIGRAYFELCDYHQAEHLFAEVRRIEPHRVDGLEIYSTVLWHLQSEVVLSALAQDLTDFDKMSPQAWCTAGNCFSLQKEHDIAIRYFQRAIQIDPLFAYAYTLLGHEYVLIDELDKALAAFRNSLRLDPRHYNAWYGVGMVYYKQEKFVLAEFHFNKALSINPQSSALLCNIGVVQHALKKSDRALLTLDRAIAIDPRNPLCKFHRASILFASDRHTEALQELEQLKQIVPKESLVYFLIAKVHKKLGNTHLALINFSWATDLDPKGTNNHIKEALDKRYMVDDDGDEEDISNISGMDPVASGTLDATSHSSMMEADDFQLRAVESDESL